MAVAYINTYVSTDIIFRRPRVDFVSHLKWPTRISLISLQYSSKPFPEESQVISHYY